MHRPIPAHFEEPPWTAPLDPQATLDAIPADTTVAGMFLEPMARVVRAHGGAEHEIRDRYLKFRFYPLREHVELLLDCCAIQLPGRPLRVALRKLGRVAPKIMLESQVGRVTIASAEGPTEVLRALCTTLPIYMKPCEAAVVDDGDRRAIVRLRGVHYFLDCHFVGLFEAALGIADVRGNVQIRSYSPSAADFLLSW